MALSMDEQRMLAEIERRLAAEDPGLASRLSAFRRPRPSGGFRTTRGKIIGSISAVIVLTIIGLTVYAMLSLRAYSLRPQAGRQATASSAASAPPKTAPPAATSTRP